MKRGNRAREVGSPRLDAAGFVSRRTLLGATGLAAGVTALLTAGQTVAPLAPLAAFAPRDRDPGPQGLPVNRTSAQAGVARAATDPRWRLVVAVPGSGDRPAELSRAELEALTQTDAELPIACVEGWSATGAWTGPTIAAVLGHVGAPTGTDLHVTSLEPHGAYRSMTMPAVYAADPLTLVALRLGGEPLHLEHGYPARVIAPGRPGVLQTKWLSGIEVLA